MSQSLTLAPRSLAPPAVAIQPRPGEAARPQSVPLRPLMALRTREARPQGFRVPLP